MTKQDKQDAVVQPREIVEVPFYDQLVLAAVVNPGQPVGRAVYIPVRPLCEGLGLNWSGQQQRIRRDPVLSRHAEIVCVTHTNPAGGNPNMLCLPLDRVNGWLFGLNAARVKEEARDQVIRYQEELYDAIFDYCARRAGQILSRETLALPADVDAAQLAQDIRETRIGVDGVLDFLWRRMRHDDVVRKLLEMVRLDIHEVGGLLEDGDAITERQRQTLYQLGLEVAALLGQAGEAQNTFAIVFGGLKKRFGLGKKQTYREIRRDDYRAAFDFLANWKLDVQRRIREQGDEPCIL